MMKYKTNKDRGKMPISLRISLWISGALFVIDGLCAFIFGFMPVSVPLPVMDAFMDLGFGWSTFRSAGSESMEEAMQPHPVHVGFSIIGLILGFIAVFILVSAVVSVVRAVKAKKEEKKTADSAKETKAEKRKEKTLSGKLGLSQLIALGVSGLLFAFHGICAHYLHHMPLCVTSTPGNRHIEYGFGWCVERYYLTSSGESPAELPRYFIHFLPEILIPGVVAVCVIAAAVVLVPRAVRARKEAKLNAAAAESSAEESKADGSKKKTLLRRLGLSILIALGVSGLLFAVYGLCARFLGHMPLGRRMWGGECIQEAGFGWLITTTYPLSSGVSSASSRTCIDIYPQSLISGTFLIFIAAAAVVFIIGAIKDATAKKATE